MSSLHNPFNSHRCLTAKRGFTLIEMIVSISVLLLVLGGGLAAYIRFNDRQSLVAAGNRLEVLLRTAQKKVRSGDTPAACDVLEGYSVTTVASSPTVTLVANCANGDHQVSTETLTGNVVAGASTTAAFFRSAGGGNGGTFTLENGTHQYQVEVTTGGGISNSGVIN